MADQSAPAHRSDQPARDRTLIILAAGAVVILALIALAYCSLRDRGDDSPTAAPTSTSPSATRSPGPTLTDGAGVPINSPSAVAPSRVPTASPTRSRVPRTPATSSATSGLETADGEIPNGAPDTGGGSTAGRYSPGLIMAGGGVLLLIALAALVAGRRPRTGS